MLVASHVFLLLLHRLPRSTLFPYTTLFRSRLAIAERLPLLGPETRETRDGLRGVPDLCRSRVQRGGQDRKSTRLNSSHMSISYAVFCLKKKRPSPGRPHPTGSTRY